MFEYLKSSFGISSLICGIIFLVLAAPVEGQVFTTVSNGNWNSPTTWSGGLVPNTDEVAAGVTINVYHSVFYDRGTPIRNRGTINIERVLPATAAKLTIPSGINIENLPTGNFFVLLATLQQCRFVPCNDGQPYAGTTPGAAQQAGTFRNIGGYVEVDGSIFEIAGDWTNESGGIRYVEDSCVLTGGSYSSSGAANDEVIRSSISIGWHGHGDFQIVGSTITFTRAMIQLAGSTGSFTLDGASRAGGRIDYISLRNPSGGFVGTGQIFAHPDLKDLNGINQPNIIQLDAYCVSAPANYQPNGKFFGAQAAICDNRFTCQTTNPTAGESTLQGRVTNYDGRGIGGVRVMLTGDDLDAPIMAITSPFGYYKIEGLTAGRIYTASIQSKRYRFADPVRVISLLDSFAEVNFTVEPPLPVKSVRAGKK